MGDRPSTLIGPIGNETKRNQTRYTFLVPHPRISAGGIGNPSTLIGPIGNESKPDEACLSCLPSPHSCFLLPPPACQLQNASGRCFDQDGGDQLSMCA